MLPSKCLVCYADLIKREDTGTVYLCSKQDHYLYCVYEHDNLLFYESFSLGDYEIYNDILDIGTRCLVIIENKTTAQISNLRIDPSVTIKQLQKILNLI